MQTALTSLWCCAGWKFPSKLRIFSLPHHPPVGLHPSQGDKQNLFPAGTASYLWIHQVQSRSDWAAVRRSRWRIHRTTIERFISVYRLEENGDLLKEGTGDAVGWALRACSYKTKTEASQRRRSRDTLQGVFLVLSSSLFITLSLPLFDSSSLCLFLSLTLRLMRQLMGINGEPFLLGAHPFWNMNVHEFDSWKSITVR